MALVVLLKGVNVGGHRTFRPSTLAREMKRYDVVNIGAAGTFVVRAPVGRTKLRAELARRLPFDTAVMICGGGDFLRFAASDPFGEQAFDRNIIPFVSVLARRRAPSSPLPISFPTEAEWGLRILGQQGQFVFGHYRREMKAIGYLGQLEKIYRVPVTTRNWNTISAIARALDRTPRR